MSILNFFDPSLDIAMPFDPQELQSTTSEPGVYLMKGKGDKILYVGKAKNLKKRLTQYFIPGRDGRPMVPFLTLQIETIDTITTFSEKEALLLENTLIKRHRPKYNVLLKDDKTFVSLLINHHHPYPMVKMIRYRDKPREKGALFGPYTSAYAARQTVDLMSRIFKLRQCSDRELNLRTRPCLLYSIGRCLAPCVSKCTDTTYRQEVERAIAFLKGNDAEVIDDLKRAMEEAAENLEFERAQLILESIQRIEDVTREKQAIVGTRAIERDVLALHGEKGRSLIAKLLFRKGKLIGAESYPLEEIASSEEELWETFLLQHYSNKLAIPSEIILPITLEQGSLLEEILREQKEGSVRLIHPQRGERCRQLSLAQKNATVLFHQLWTKMPAREDLLLEIQEACLLTHYPLSIECFDTSNISGSDPVACMVGFNDGIRDKKQTRLFHIKTAKGGDDYGALREVMRRHYTKAKESDALPDLIVIDGGKGQLTVALEVLTNLGIASVDVIALTKEEGRHDKGLTKEKVFIPHHRDPIIFSPRSSALFLLQQMRDEAHKAALSFQRKKRGKRTIQSSLDRIPGIGPKKRNRLLHHFGSAKQVAKASREELKREGKLSDRDIETIYQFFESH